jgi:methylglutaconyl-CoA hydratase
VAAADYSIATSGASVRLSELAVGIGPFVVGPAIERKIGTGAFAAMALDADWRDAAWAERHGLYARVVDDAPALDAEVDRRVTTLAAANPEAVQGIKRAAWAGTDDWAALLEQRAATSGTLVLSEFTRSAIAAFGAK